MLRVFVATLLLLKSCHGLLYPASSTLGLTSSVSVPVTELFPERRLIVDWCFAMSYELPYQLSSFYNIPIWPGKHSPKVRKRSMHFAEDEKEFEVNSIDNWAHLRHNYYNTTLHSGKHPSDFTAGELYQSIEDFLVSYGFHETCLLKSVCELAKHPFDEDYRNIFTEILTFLLTPSMHEGFAPDETIYQQTYEEAEKYGFLQENCSAMYPDCERDLLGLITKIIHT